MKGILNVTGVGKSPPLTQEEFRNLVNEIRERPLVPVDEKVYVCPTDLERMLS